MLSWDYFQDNTKVAKKQRPTRSLPTKRVSKHLSRKAKDERDKDKAKRCFAILVQVGEKLIDTLTFGKRLPSLAFFTPKIKKASPNNQD